MSDRLETLRQAAQSIRSAQADRDRLIQKRVSEGVSLREIAAAAGVSHEQVRRIAKH